MSRCDEPNASHYSARYAERKRARERAADATMGLQPCLRCAAHQAPGTLFCVAHAVEHKRLIDAKDWDGARDFAQRTYWPEVSQ